MDFGNKVALVTGGSSGIGLAISKALAAEGAHVWIMARNQNRMIAAIEQFNGIRKSPHQRFGYLQVDVSNQDQVGAALAQMEKEVGIPDLLVTAAGETYPGYVEDIPLEVFCQMMEIDYMGTVYCVKGVLPGMLQRGSGTIVTVSSGAGFVGIFGYSAYTGAKYAVRGFTDVIRQELKPRGIQVSIVFPPDTDTPQLAFEDPIKPFETRELVGRVQPVSAEFVAENVLRDVAKGKYVIIPGFKTKAYYRIFGLMGDLVYPLADSWVRDALKKKAKLGNNGHSIGPKPESGNDSKPSIPE